jgi:1,4-alpha-glucan branching enzyme
MEQTYCHLHDGMRLDACAGILSADKDLGARIKRSKLVEQQHSELIVGVVRSETV